MTNNRLFSPTHGCRAMRAMTIAVLMLFFTTSGISQNLNAPTLLKDIAAGTATSNPRGFVNLSSGLSFFIAEENNLSKLFKTDGTTAGTQVVSGTPTALTKGLAVLNGKVYFISTQSTATKVSILLYSTNGTTTSFVDTLASYQFGTIQQIESLNLFAKNGTLYYELGVGTFRSGTNLELYAHNGQVNGSRFVNGGGGIVTYGQNAVFSINNISNAGNNSSAVVFTINRKTATPANLVVFQYDWTTSNGPPTAANIRPIAVTLTNDVFYCTINDTLVKYTSNGVKTVIKTGVGNAISGAAIGATAYFVNEGNNLWQTDGTAAGTKRVPVQSFSPFDNISSALYVVNNKLVYQHAINGTRQFDVYAYNGTTEELIVTPDQAQSSIGKLTVLGDRIYFLREYAGSSNKTELYQSDGTAAGTIFQQISATFQECLNNSPTPFPCINISGGFLSNFAGAQVSPNKVIFSLPTATYGSEPWTIDLNPPTVALPDFSCKISNLSVDPLPTAYPRDPYTAIVRFTRTIIGTNLNTSDTRVFRLRGYVSSDSILSSDDKVMFNQDLSQDYFTRYRVQEFPIAVTPIRSGLNYIIFKIDADNDITESNENNNVSNASPFTAYALSCTSNGLAPWNEWISNVKLNTINKTSEKTRYDNVSPVVNGYSNFLDVSTTLSKGQSYPLSITPSLGYPTYPTNLFTRVWIDYNQNGIFEDAEIVLSKNGNQVATQNITVPTTALTGITAMRVSMKAGAYPTACEVFAKGEVEDYTITIQDGTVAQLPDLTIQNFILTTPSVQLGETIYYTVDAKNIGTANTTQENIQSYLSLDRTLDATDLAIGSIAFFLPPVGQTITGLQGGLSTISLGTAGNYYIIVKIDPDNTVAESNENNNVIVSPTTVTIRPVINTNTCRNQDSLQLVRLYSATNGANWINKWNLATPINTWFGVTLNANGCVSSVNLTNNNVNGSLPNLDMPNLETLILQGNPLTLTIPNLSLPNLTRLDLSICKFMGAIPNFNLPKIQYLALFSNQLTGAIPNFTYPNLVSLSLANNQLTGSIPNFNLPKLVVLALNDNKLTGSIPNLVNTPLINSFVVYSNQLSGCIPAFLKSMCNIYTIVDFSNNPSLNNQNFATFCANNTGACVVANNSCRNQDSLQLVSLYNATNGANWTNKWNLATPINTWHGVTLNADGCVLRLRLEINNLVGTIPNLNIPNLDGLYLYENKLSGTIPNFNLPKVEQIYLSMNQLTGTIPNFNLPNLTQLVLFENQLTGSIPNFNLLPKLRGLLLMSNRLTGTIPNFNFLNLEALWLADNALTGAIPNFNFSAAASILLQSNQLTSIPNFNFPLLVTLNLGKNKFSGPIPNFSSTTLPNLTNLYLDNNNFSGCVPNSLKTFCGKNVDINQNPLLATQDFAAFCANNTGACVPTSNEDITLTIASTPSVYNQFQTNTFKITAKNNKVTGFADVKIEFKFPAKTVSGGTAVPSVGTWQEWCAGGVQCYTWTIPNLAAGTTATLNVPLFVLDATAPIVATTKVLSVSPQASSNVATVTVNRATAPTTQPLAFQVPTQQVPVVIQRIAPNPTEGDVVVKLDSWKEQEVDFNFSDITGKTIHSEKRQLDKGVNKVQFDLYHLPQGVYFIQTNVGKGTNVPTKFVKM
jgi:GEVED domain/CARDB/Secretion system C-terminal sorting domain/Domain of unknown function DUF11